MNPFSPPIMTGLFVGALIAAGLLIMWRGFHPVKLSAAETIRVAGQRFVSTPSGWRAQTLQFAARTGDNDTMAADLAVLGRTPTDFAIARIQLCSALGILPVIVSVVITSATGGTWNVFVVGLCAAFGVVAGLALSKATLASEAAGRRRGFTQELAAYLDVVAQLVAGGAGVDEALWRAARSAQTPGLTMIRNTLSSARVRRRSEWSELGDLATAARLPPLAELVTAIQLASSDGARIRASLQAKAKSLRAATASEQLTAANRASEYMGGPLIAMLMAFLAVVLAPALAQVLAIN
jgi:tight adherence protein C